MISKTYKNIDLTLSGHTHGFQFGIEIGGFRWSPVKFMYKHWADLYNNDQQYLYVNRGLGCLGYPGRVGILPEITVLELT
jgi:predicted MPP superfamily phosphohydrolase